MLHPGPFHGIGVALNGSSLDRTRVRIFIAALAGLLLAFVGCGRQAPFYAPASLTVTSTPPGAAILIDGQDTGLVTPHTFAEMNRGAYEVTVRLDGFVSSPGSELVDLAPLASRTVDFTLEQSGIEVNSQPAGAGILLDGIDTGQVTPAVLTGVAAGSHTIGLHLDGHLVFPASVPVTVGEGFVQVQASSFLIRARHTVLCEGFTNIFCNGCPQLSADLHGMQAEPGFGPDQVVILKYSRQWPLITDPHYQYNTADNDARPAYYGFANTRALPPLYVDGSRSGTAGSPPDQTGIEGAVTGAATATPGFIVDVEADRSGLSVPVTVTLTALDGGVDLAGSTLRVALVQSEVDYPAPPVEPNLGETTFYWVFRDQAPDITGLGTLGSGVPSVFTTTVARDDWDPATVEVIAYVQRDSDKVVLQAGSTMTLPLASFTGSVPEGNSP